MFKRFDDAKLLPVFIDFDKGFVINIDDDAPNRYSVYANIHGIPYCIHVAQNQDDAVAFAMNLTIELDGSTIDEKEIVLPDDITALFVGTDGTTAYAIGYDGNLFTVAKFDNVHVARGYVLTAGTKFDQLTRIENYHIFIRESAVKDFVIDVNNDIYLIESFGCNLAFVNRCDNRADAESLIKLLTRRYIKE